MDHHVDDGQMDGHRYTLHRPTTRTARGVFPPPLVIPATLQHRHTLILLHGRGSTAERFSTPLQEEAVDGRTLQTTFPHAKLVFLTAAKSRAKRYNKSFTHQWFDNWHMDRRKSNERIQRQHMMQEGLLQSVNYIHGILQDEIDEIGSQNVMLWGLSQGCAASLSAALTWEGEAFAGVIGMCGYLPFANVFDIPLRSDSCVRINNVVSDGINENCDSTRNKDESEDDEEDDEEESEADEADNEEDIAFDYDDASSSIDFETGYEDPTCGFSNESELDPFFGDTEQDNVKNGCSSLTAFREELDMESPIGTVLVQDISVFLGHGTKDDKVDVEYAREAKDCLEAVGVSTQLVEHEGLNHWYSEEMLRDIFTFIRTRLS